MQLTSWSSQSSGRTFAQLAYDAGVPTTQISRLLGHANVGTTQRYLNLDLDLEVTASDFVPLAFPPGAPPSARGVSESGD